MSKLTADGPGHLSQTAIDVRSRLVALGLETPMLPQPLSKAEQIERVETAMQSVMKTLALDLTDDSLADTPKRIAKMYVNEIFSGLDYTHFPKMTQIENKMGTREMIAVRDISLTSTCEHHFVTIDGFADVAYLPKDRIIGLSKINRLVRFFAQRPQVQERLTQQVMVALQVILDTDDVAVKINATHYCVKARGVMDSTSSTQTLAMGGVFAEHGKHRQDFLG